MIDTELHFSKQSQISKSNDTKRNHYTYNSNLLYFIPLEDLVGLLNLAILEIDVIFTDNCQLITAEKTTLFSDCKALLATRIQGRGQRLKFVGGTDFAILRCSVTDW